MASKKSYITYSKEAFYELSNVYMEGNSQLALLEKLRELGARRILFICSAEIERFKNFERLFSDYAKFGFRCFVYSRKKGLLKESDVLEALDVYREYNCDTIVTVGGVSEIDCGKFVSAMHTNGTKTISELVGLNSIKRDISLVCCIVTDNSSNAATPFAEYLDVLHNKWYTSYSSYLIPQIVVLDSELCVRSEMAQCIDGALSSLCMAIESYINPIAVASPEYKADALLAIRIIMNTLDKVVNSPDNSYLRRKLACGGFYAGVASTKTGLGYAHLIVHSLIERYGDIHGTVYLKLLIAVLHKSMDFTMSSIAELARELHVCNQSVDDSSAATLMIEALERLVEKYSDLSFIPLVSEADSRKIADEVRRNAALFDLKRITNETMLSVFNMVAGRQ